MKKIFYLALFLSACAENVTTENEIGPTEVIISKVKTDSETVEKTVSPIEIQEVGDRPTLDRLSFGGLRSYEEANAFIEKIRTLGETKNRTGVVDMVRFPFTTHNNGEPQNTYENKEELLVDIKWILTDATLNQMASTTYDDFILNWRGGGLAGGKIWFNEFDDDIKIFRISGQTWQ